MAKTFIKGAAVAVISQYTRFNPAKPNDTPAHSFTFISEHSLDKEGNLNSTWASNGFVLAGRAEITVELIDTNTMQANAVQSLREQRKTAEREFAAKVMEIDRRINSLLAIENEVAQ